MFWLPPYPAPTFLISCYSPLSKSSCSSHVTLNSSHNTDPALMCPERDPEALVPVAVEGAVLAALDSETDAALASLLQVRVASSSTCA